MEEMDNPDDTLSDEQLAKMDAERVAAIKKIRDDRWIMLREEHELMIKMSDQVRKERAAQSGSGNTTTVNVKI